MKAAIAQIKPTLGNIERNLKIMMEKIEEAREKGMDIVVFPELALSGYLLEEMVYDVCVEIPEELLEASRDIGILFGGVERGGDNFIYNSAFYLEDGKLLHTHRKVYLPTYGMFFEGRYFKGGDRFRAFDTKHGRFGILICEDAWHQSASYILGQDGADYIFCLVSSPARGFELGVESMAKDWEGIAYQTATMTGTYFVMANRVGVEDGVSFWGGSEVVAPTGKILAKGEYLKEDMLFVDMPERELRRARFSSPVMKSEDIDLTIRELKRIQNKRYQ